MNSGSYFPDIIDIVPIILLVAGGLFSMLRASSARLGFPVLVVASLFFLPAIGWQISELVSNNSESSYWASSQLVKFTQLFLLVIAYFSSLNFNDAKYQLKSGLGERLALIFFATSGAYVLLVAKDLLAWYLALEIVAISSYALVAADLKSKLGTEAAIKYVVQGALGSALILFSFALVYGLTGTLDLAAAQKEIFHQDFKIQALSLGFFIIGLAIKIGLVPFHYWVADVYQAAETSVSNYLAAVAKFAVAIGGFSLISGLFLKTFEAHTGFGSIVWLIVVLSVIAGNLLAISQKDTKRMLACSAIAHSAYFFSGFLLPGDQSFAAAFYAYLVFYTLVSLLAFTALDALDGPAELPASRLQGLIYRAPFLGFALIVALLSLAGLPPIFYALLAKIYLLKVILAGGYFGIAAVIVLGAVLGCYYYFRAIALIVSRPLEDSSSAIQVSKTKVFTLGCLLLTLVYYTIYPTRIFDYLQGFLS